MTLEVVRTQRHTVTLIPNAVGYGFHEIHVDGLDISRGVRSLNLTLKPGHHAQVCLEMAVVEVDRVEFDTPHLHIPDATRDALIALGWTPPVDEV